VRAAGAWLPTHPTRELITRRYLAHQRDLVATAVSRRADVEEIPVPTTEDDTVDERTRPRRAPQGGRAGGAGRRGGSPRGRPRLRRGRAAAGAAPSPGVHGGARGRR